MTHEQNEQKIGFRNFTPLIDAYQVESELILAVWNKGYTYGEYILSPLLAVDLLSGLNRLSPNLPSFEENKSKFIAMVKRYQDERLKYVVANGNVELARKWQYEKYDRFTSPLSISGIEVREDVAAVPGRARSILIVIDLGRLLIGFDIPEETASRLQYSLSSYVHL